MDRGQVHGTLLHYETESSETAADGNDGDNHSNSSDGTVTTMDSLMVHPGDEEVVNSVIMDITGDTPGDDTHEIEEDTEEDGISHLDEESISGAATGDKLSLPSGSLSKVSLSCLCIVEFVSIY